MSETIRRIEAKDLRPGDVFEYATRDAVLPDGPWRSWWGPLDRAVKTAVVTRPEGSPDVGQEHTLIHAEVDRARHGACPVTAPDEAAR